MGFLVVPGVWDGLSAKVAASAGFGAVYVSGGAISRAKGLPDLGLMSSTEVRDRIEEIVAAVDVPVIADADTGYGNALNVVRTVRELSLRGVAAIQLEDQITPKRCGHYGNKEVVAVGEMVGKIRAALDALEGEDVLLIARTDARAPLGLEEAVRRARIYREAGADILFVEAPETEEELRRIASDLAGMPLLVNMFEGGRTPLVSAAELKAMGYTIMIAPSDLQRASIRAMQRVAQTLKEDGSSHALSGDMASFSEREAVIGKASWDEMADRYGSDPDLS